MDDFKKELDDYFCRFTFGQFVTLILLEIVTLFFVFYLGAHYGPDLLGQRETKKETLLPKEGAKSIDEIVGTPPVDYTYPEVLTRPEGQKAVPIKPSGVTAEEYENKAPESPPPAQPEEKTAPEEVPPPAVKPREEPEPTKASHFSIQVGSYQSAEEATKTMNQWKKKGYQAFLGVGEIPKKGIWYRVRIGTFKTRPAADQFLDQFKKKEKASGLVVKSKS